MHDLILELFGTYEPVLDAEGNVLPGLAGVDVPYCAGVLLFGLMLYCVFRIIGGVIIGRNK